MGMPSITSPIVVLTLFLQFLCFMVTTTSSTATQRIAEGELTTLGQYPAVLSLGLTSWANIYHLHYCSGSIITERWVVTSAQCVEDAVEDVSRYYWLAGTNNLRERGSQYSINRIIIHPDYNPNNSFIHDVALVQVKYPFEFSASIQPIELSTLIGDTSPGTPGVVVGWGQVSQSVIQPDVLRSADVTILDVDVCGEIYSSWGINVDGEYQFCAVTGAVDQSAKVHNIVKYQAEIEYDPIEERSACRGDEGGPFFIRGTNFPSRVSGIVSWTYGCSPFGYPAVYTKISAYLQWISQNTDYWI